MSITGQNLGVNDLTKISMYLGQNIEALRTEKGLSQAQLASQAQIPRSTLTNIESGVGNPSLNNLIRISLALGVSVEELLSRPRPECLLVKALDVPVQDRSHGRARLFKLLPERIKGIEIDRMELAPEAIMGGHPHLEGTKEYLTVIEGEIAIHVAGERHVVRRGDVLAFPGNRAHSYRNTRKTVSVALSVVIPIPVFV